MSLPASRKTKAYYINSAVSLLIILVFHLLPPFSTLTRTGMDVAGIFIGVIYAFSTVDIIWPALLGIVLLGTTELYTMQSAFSAAFGSDTWLFILFVLAFAQIVTDSGVSAIIAGRMVSWKLSRRRPWVISWLLLTTAYVVAALVSVTPGIIIPWSILYTMCGHYGYKKGDKYPTVMVIGIALAAMMGNTAFPFKSLSAMVMKSYGNITGAGIGFGEYTVLAVALGYGMVLVYLLLCRFVFRPDVSAIRTSDYVYEGGERMTPYQKKILALLAAFFVALFAPGILPEAVPGVAFLKSVGNTAICVLLLVLAGFFVSRETGKSVIDLGSTLKKSTPWPTMLLLAFALIMTSAITNEATGIKPFLESLFAPVFGSTPSSFLFILAVCAVQLILTNVFANMVIALLLVPLVCTYAPMAGVSSAMMCVTVCVLVNAALLLPSASPFGALLHGNSEWVTSKEIYRYFGTALVFILIASALICSLLGAALF